MVYQFIKSIIGHIRVASFTNSACIKAVICLFKNIYVYRTFVLALLFTVTDCL